MTPKKRDKISLIEYLLENYFDTEEQAKTAVKLQIVYLNKKIVKRIGISINKVSDQITVVGEGILFVSRGGYKLKEAIDSFGVKVEKRICLDIGSSTGGFTDCLLQSGAGFIYAVDTGYGQLAWEIRKNPKVKCLERMNVRYLLPERLYGSESQETKRADLAVIDVSFISVLKVLPSVQNLVSGKGSEFIILMKPQFEAGKDQVARGGVIRNKELHQAILLKFLINCFRTGLVLKKISYSPLLGVSGNLEFLVFASWSRQNTEQAIVQKKQESLINLKEWSQRVVELAYSRFAI